MSFYKLYQKSLAKIIIDAAEKIVKSDKTWEEKFNLIFSEEISKAFLAACPNFDYHDPDCSYEDDVLAWINAAKYHAKWNIDLDKALVEG